MTIPLVSPRTHVALETRGDELVDPSTNEVVGRLRRGVPTFVSDDEDYAENFGWQWNQWVDLLSDSRDASNESAKQHLLLRRTHFDYFPIEGKTVLECGMGGGDDTEVLLSLPFAEVHSFDLSRAVDRARAVLSDPRLVLARANIYAIPYPDASFDFVFCHRVLQHTPDPLEALRCIGRKVKPGGVLFVHCYHRSWFFMQSYKYKLRWLTSRIPASWLHRVIDVAAPSLQRANAALRRRGFLGRTLADNFIPFEWVPHYGKKTPRELLELAKMITVDALAPQHDHPLRWPELRKVLVEEGFEPVFYHDMANMPLLCTAVRTP
jgi:ubiquinone/menaquinone biosynthesis C-methylase UbiE